MSVPPHQVFTPQDPRPATFGRLWSRLPRELGFLLLGLPISVAGLVLFTTLVSIGLSLAVFTVGLFVLVAALLCARGFGALELRRLERAGQPGIAAPRWQEAEPSRGFWGRTLTPLRDGASWWYLLHGWIVQPAVGIATWCVVVTWIAMVLGGITYWFWSRFLPISEDDIFLHRVIIDWVFPGNGWVIDSRLGESVMNLVAGLESLAARSPIPVEFLRTLSPELVLAPEVERNAYFVVAELLTNAAKHSGAAGIRLELSDRGGEATGRELVLRVEDNGVGGAALQEGHGLSGLTDRLSGLLGDLTVESPSGGPTRVTARFPLPR